MRKGDIILVPFPYTNLKGYKRRPAVVLYKGTFDVIVSFITTNIEWMDNTDIKIHPDEFNGLKKVSLIKADKIATLEIKIVIGKIGILNKTQLSHLNESLKILFGIN